MLQCGHVRGCGSPGRVIAQDYPVARLDEIVGLLAELNNVAFFGGKPHDRTMRSGRTTAYLTIYRPTTPWPTARAAKA